MLREEAAHCRRLAELVTEQCSAGIRSLPPTTRGLIGEALPISSLREPGTLSCPHGQPLEGSPSHPDRGSWRRSARSRTAAGQSALILVTRFARVPYRAAWRRGKLEGCDHISHRRHRCAKDSQLNNQQFRWRRRDVGHRIALASLSVNGFQCSHRDPLAGQL